MKEYFEDSKELTNEEMKQLSSEWSERRRLSLVEKEKKKRRRGGGTERNVETGSGNDE